MRIPEVLLPFAIFAAWTLPLTAAPPEALRIANLSETKKSQLKKMACSALKGRNFLDVTIEEEDPNAAVSIKRTKRLLAPEAVGEGGNDFFVVILREKEPIATRDGPDPTSAEPIILRPRSEVNLTQEQATLTTLDPNQGFAEISSNRVLKVELVDGATFENAVDAETGLPKGFDEGYCSPETAADSWF